MLKKSTDKRKKLNNINVMRKPGRNEKLIIAEWLKRRLGYRRKSMPAEAEMSRLFLFLLSQRRRPLSSWITLIELWGFLVLQLMKKQTQHLIS